MMKFLKYAKSNTALRNAESGPATPDSGQSRDIGGGYSLFEDLPGSNADPVLRGPFHHVGGHCWSVEVPHLAALADDANDPNRSTLALFENGRLLMQNHALHAEIARVGEGRHSHWGPSLYFSTSDNSDPNGNGRTYSIRKRKDIEDVIDEQMLTQIALNDGLMYQLITRGINTNAHALNQALFSYRKLKELLGRTGENHAGKVVFEIGASPRLGLPLIFALTGAEKYIANNVLGISRNVSIDFLRLLQLMMYAIEGEEHLRDIGEIVSEDAPVSREAAGRVDPEIVHIIDETPAELADIASNSVDIVFSQSVLEHVSDPLAVLQKNFDVLKPGAFAFHAVDLTEHGSSFEPLRFLKEHHDEYVERTGGPENRVRYSEFIDMIRQVGFEIHSTKLYTKQNEHLPNGSVDIAKHMESGFRLSESYSSLDAVVPWVDDAYKSQFSAPYSSMDNRDLSVLYFDVICRKPEANPTSS